VDIENTARVTSYVLSVEVEEQMGLDVMLMFSR
jgi:hypothetical protein